MKVDDEIQVGSLWMRDTSKSYSPIDNGYVIIITGNKLGDIIEYIEYSSFNNGAAHEHIISRVGINELFKRVK